MNNVTDRMVEAALRAYRDAQSRRGAYNPLAWMRPAIEAALREQPAPEPVAWRYKTNLPGARWEVSTMSPAEAREWNIIVEEQPLYTHPPQQRKPLTEEEIVDAVREADLDWQKGWTLDEHAPNRFITLARAVERKVRGEEK